MKTLLLIGSGSFVGGVLRYLLSQLIQIKTDSSFPVGTLGVNIVGCFLIGLIVGYIDKENLGVEWRFLLVTGLLGGFTTFSAFSMESINLLREGQIGFALSYIALSIILGLSATFFAFSIFGNK
ncbi:fluoride efflux transporter CrcB [Albibacterium bauzanense]|uniref:Fluoride-specific ion channel FluC n=1 Tax=Albibacterium bauzanense TaxID=653929 RepID=A0A4R1M4X4_9SPHI|nr:fluoride efflux transporter CrcB [Albibacterium bauzanense]TCK84749.1 camphor resistance protein CrcB [Albibacterium bauzanense]